MYKDTAFRLIISSKSDRYHEAQTLHKVQLDLNRNNGYNILI